MLSLLLSLGLALPTTVIASEPPEFPEIIEIDLTPDNTLSPEEEVELLLTRDRALDPLKEQALLLEIAATIEEERLEAARLAAEQAEQARQARAAEEARLAAQRTQAPAPTSTSGVPWDAIARCESGYGGEPNWSINTGNGYYGGLQFNKSSWDWAGGQKYAEWPHHATREQQIAVAERLLAIHPAGLGAWPACTRKLGLR